MAFLELRLAPRGLGNRRSKPFSGVPYAPYCPRRAHPARCCIHVWVSSDVKVLPPPAHTCLLVTPCNFGAFERNRIRASGSHWRAKSKPSHLYSPHDDVKRKLPSRRCRACGRAASAHHYVLNGGRNSMHSVPESEPAQGLAHPGNVESDEQSSWKESREESTGPHCPRS